MRLAGSHQGLAHPPDHDGQQCGPLRTGETGLYDLREQSRRRKGKLQEIFFGEDNYCLVQIPPGIANGYKAYGDKMVILGQLRDRAARPERDAADGSVYVRDTV